MNECVPHNVLLLGKIGHGKSTVGNRLLNSEGWFRINNQGCSQTCSGSALLNSSSQLKNYNISVFDHDGLFEGAYTIDKLCHDVPQVLNLVMFMLKRGCSFDTKGTKLLKTVATKWKISEISALVLTHCERLSEEERGEMIEQFKKDHPSVAELMGKGILAVGFPNGSHVQPGSELSERVEGDKKKLRQLIYSCDEEVSIPQTHGKQHYPVVKTFSYPRSGEMQDLSHLLSKYRISERRPSL